MKLLCKQREGETKPKEKTTLKPDENFNENAIFRKIIKREFRKFDQ